jgi:hypothetical protein
MYVCMYVCMCVCMYVFLYVCITYLYPRISSALMAVRHPTRLDCTHIFTSNEVLLYNRLLCHTHCQFPPYSNNGMAVECDRF